MHFAWFAFDKFKACFVSIRGNWERLQRLDSHRSKYSAGWSERQTGQHKNFALRSVHFDLTGTWCCTSTAATGGANLTISHSDSNIAWLHISLCCRRRQLLVNLFPDFFQEHAMQSLMIAAATLQWAETLRPTRRLVGIQCLLLHSSLHKRLVCELWHFMLEQIHWPCSVNTLCPCLDDIIRLKRILGTPAISPQP